MSYYIVYSYVPSWGQYAPTKYIEGIYIELEKARNRQVVVCGENARPGINKSLYGNGKTSFINVVPIGDCHIEMFTTSLNYQKRI